MNIPSVREFMATSLITLKPDMNIYKAIKVLLKHKISGAPVVDADHNLLGIISEKDCLRIFANGAFNQLPEGLVSDYMTKTIVTVNPEEGLFYVADIFFRYHFRRLPVIEHGKLVGQVSRRDVLNGSRKIWEESPIKKEWTDAKYLTEEIKAALVGPPG